MSNEEALVEMRAAASGSNGNGGQAEHPSLLSGLIEEIEQTILQFVELESSEIATLLALWIVQSYRLEAFAFCGFLSMQSASPRCGKSRLLEILGCFTEEPTPLRTMPSPAVLYRSESLVIFLDEVDGLRNQDKEKYGEVIALLNVAFKRGGIVERCNKQTLKVERFSAYRAFAFAGLNSLSDTLADRCFPIRLKRASRKMKRLNVVKLENDFQGIRNKLSQWWIRYEADVKQAYEALPDETRQLRDLHLDDRMQDISEPLLVLAVCADAEMGEGQPVTEKFLRGIKTIAGRREASPVEDSLKAFLDIGEARLGGNEHIFIPTHELIDLCREVDPLEWIDTPRRLSGFLKKFDLYPKNQGGKIRGYSLTLEWVQEWRGRYA